VWPAPGQVAVHGAEEDQAEAMRSVEADPGRPHRCLACDNGRGLLHACLQLTIAGQQHWPAKRIQQMHQDPTPERSPHSQPQAQMRGCSR
jgi:hypothetical protein